MEKKRVIVTGGGASGLMAAIAAAENGAAVTILEQNEKPGKKICATGNGKCNFTNIQVPSDAYRSENPGFEQAVLNQFPVEDTVKFFTRLGIYPVNKNGGYLYPHSGQAASVAEVLCMEARNLGVKIKTNQKVQRVFKEQDIWKVQVEGWIYEGEAVILANGSKASAISLLPFPDSSNLSISFSLLVIIMSSSKDCFDSIVAAGLLNCPINMDEMSPLKYFPPLETVCTALRNSSLLEPFNK